MDRKIIDEAIEWFGRLRAHNVTPAEKEAFERWQEISPSHRQAFHKVSAAWDHPVFKAAAVQSASSSNLSALSAASPHRVLWPSIAAAAVVGTILILGLLQWDLWTRLQADYITAVGELRTIQLPDHSSVTLNTQTAITIDFAGTARKIKLLKGQAFFKVTADRERPFIVEHQGITTTAVGTAFEVHGQGSRVGVTVVEGSVEVADSNENWPQIAVAAGNQVRVAREQADSPRKIDPSSATAWLRGRLVVTTALLGDVLEEIRRYYPGTIITLNPNIQQIHVTGTYHLDNPSVLLATLSKTLPFQMVTIGDQLAILY